MLTHAEYDAECRTKAMSTLKETSGPAARFDEFVAALAHNGGWVGRTRSRSTARRLMVATRLLRTNPCMTNDDYRALTTATAMRWWGSILERSSCRQTSTMRGLAPKR